MHVRVSQLVDGRLSRWERIQLEKHFKICQECRTTFSELLANRHSLQGAARRPVPADLSLRLRIVASHAAAARRVTRWDVWRAHIRLMVHNLMRPLAVPVAGGITSALVLFSAISPSLVVPLPQGPDFNALVTQASIKSVGPLALPAHDVVIVEVTVDEQGKLLEYRIPESLRKTMDEAACRALAQNLLLAQFTPGTVFGQPRVSKLLLSFSRSRIDVKG